MENNNNNNSHSTSKESSRHIELYYIENPDYFYENQREIKKDMDELNNEKSQIILIKDNKNQVPISFFKENSDEIKLSSRLDMEEKRLLTTCENEHTDNIRGKELWAIVRNHFTTIKFNQKASNLLNENLNKKSLGSSKSLAIEIKTNNCLFSRKSLFIKLWKHFITLIYIHYMFVIPERMARKDDSNAFWTYCLIIDIIWLLNVFLKINTEWETPRGILRKRKLIVLEYLKNGLILDLLTSIPFFLIKKKLIWIKIIRLLYFEIFWNAFKEILFKMISFATHFLIKKQEQALRYTIFIRDGLCTIFLIYWAAHLIGSFFESISKNPKNENEWNDIFQNDTFENHYLNSIYFSLTTLTTVGYGDILPLNTDEQLFVMAVMCAGIALFAFTMGSVKMIFDLFFCYEIITSEESEDLDHWLICRENGNQLKSLSPQLAEKIKDYVYFFKKLDFYAILHEYNILDKLRLDLKKTILNRKMEHMFLAFDLFFNNLPFDMKARLSLHVKPLIIPPDTIILKKGHLSKGIYLIAIGKGLITFRYKNENLPFFKLKKGSYFGDSYFLGEPSKFTYSSGKKSELYCLFILAEALNEILIDFPKEKLNFRMKSMLRINYYQDLKNNLKTTQPKLKFKIFKEDENEEDEKKKFKELGMIKAEKNDSPKGFKERNDSRFFSKLLTKNESPTSKSEKENEIENESDNESLKSEEKNEEIINYGNNDDEQNSEEYFEDSQDEPLAVKPTVLSEEFLNPFLKYINLRGMYLKRFSKRIETNWVKQLTKLKKKIKFKLK